MPWYKVTKRINGRLYDYWQRTYRVGKSVKTQNKYIGPTTTLLRGQPIPDWRTMSAAQRYNVKMDRMFYDAKILNRQYDALREVDKPCAVCGGSGHPASAHDFKPATPTLEKFTIDPTEIAAPRTLSQSLTDVTTVADLEEKIAHTRWLISKTTERIGVGNLSEDDWHRYQDLLTKRKAALQALENQLEQSITHHLDTNLKPLLKERGVKVHEPSPTAPRIPEEAIYQLTKSTVHMHPEDRKAYEKDYAKRRAEDENIQYGNQKARIARQKSAVRKAKRDTRGIKALNPFLARGIKRPK